MVGELPYGYLCRVLGYRVSGGRCWLKIISDKGNGWVKQGVAGKDYSRSNAWFVLYPSVKPEGDEYVIRWDGASQKGSKGNGGADYGGTPRYQTWDGIDNTAVKGDLVAEYPREYYGTPMSVYWFMGKAV